MDIKELLNNGFVPYMGQYDKEFYDIVLKNKKDKKYIINDDVREIVKRCWPNAGTFHDQNGKAIRENSILAFRVSVE
jgi:hypothetical protein